MTVFVCDTPWTPRGADAPVFNLWADTSDEAIAALYAVGGSEETRRHECNSWECYTVTPDQFGDLIGLGITITDKLGPAHWCATRDGNTRLLNAIAFTRGLRATRE